MKQEKSAGAVVFRKGKEPSYLLLQYEAKHWDFPKGNIEAGEKDLETVKREVEEETGIKDLEVIDGFKEKLHYFYKLNGELISKEVIFYLAKTDTGEINLSFEHIAFKWLDYEEAMEQLTYKNAKDILKKANEFLKKNKTLDEFY
jgi:bis(5'-nucleosidyl)-tetraphosphatase